VDESLAEASLHRRASFICRRVVDSLVDMMHFGYGSSFLVRVHTAPVASPRKTGVVGVEMTHLEYSVQR
jgi:hypothetical protein